MARRPLKEDLKDELSYAVSDIRAAWERAWFDAPVTPNRWASGGMPGGQNAAEGPQPTPPAESQPVVQSHNPDVPDAIDGIGRSTAENYDPDHTRDAVRGFYGMDRQDGWDEACRGVFGETGEQPEADEDLSPDRSPRIGR